jgi:hypothetical protein
VAGLEPTPRSSRNGANPGARQAILSGDQQHLARTQRRHGPGQLLAIGFHTERGFGIPRRGQRGTLRALARRWMHGRNLNSSARPYWGADVMMDAEVGSPATGAFDVTVMGIVEPDTKPVLFGLLSRMMSDVVVGSVGRSGSSATPVE